MVFFPFFLLSFFNTLSFSFSYALIYNSYSLASYSTILFSLFNYSFIHLRLFPFSLNFDILFIFLLSYFLFFPFSFHHFFISRFSIFHLPSYFFPFLQFPLLLQSPPILFVSFFSSSSSFFQHSFHTFYNFLFPISQLQSSTSSSHLISTLPRPLFLSLANHFSLFSVHSPFLPVPVRSSPNLLLSPTQTWRKTQQPMPPRRWIMDFERGHASYLLPLGWIFIMRYVLRHARYEILDPRPAAFHETSTRSRNGTPGPATNELLWRTHRETHAEAWIVDKAWTILAGPARHSCRLFGLFRVWNRSGGKPRVVLGLPGLLFEYGVVWLRGSSSYAWLLLD